MSFWPPYHYIYIHINRYRYSHVVRVPVSKSIDSRKYVTNVQICYESISVNTHIHVWLLLVIYFCTIERSE